MRPPHKDYEFQIDQCDVNDKALLREFRNKRSEWIAWLERDDHHNIWSQIHSLMWTDAAYRSLNEARRFATEANPNASSNGMLGEFLDLGYISTQTLAICKITDRANDVISLWRLLNDIKDCRHLLTRENFVSYDALPYDYAAVQKEFIDDLKPEDVGKARWIENKGPQAWGMSQILHSAFDKLSGIAENKRSRTDLIHEDVFKNIESWFDAPILETLRTFRNKFIGHAADAPSRQRRPLNRLGFSLDDISEAQRIVIRIATAIGPTLLYDTALGSVVPTPQFDVFENLNKAIISNDNLPALQDWWREHDHQRTDWLNEHIDLITGEIRILTN